jgi:small subunit ribosomal protein S18
MAKKAPRTKNKDNARRSKKKTSVLVQESVDYIDYKDVNLLRRFMSDRAKIRARRVTGNDAQQQREVARAIKNAREMALLPYTNRVTTQRTSRERVDRGDRPGGDGPPRPQGPPPSASVVDDEVLPDDIDVNDEFELGGDAADLATADADGA